MTDSGARPAAAAHMSLRARVHMILESGHSAGLAGRVFEGALIALIVTNVLAVTLQSVPEIGRRYAAVFAAFETFSIGFFTVEYVLRLWTAPEDPRYAGLFLGRLRYALRPLMIVDFLAFAPAYFLPLTSVLDTRVLRFFRLLRLLKIARYSPALSTLAHVIVYERRSLFGTLVLLLGVMCLSAEAMHVLEGEVQPKLFGTLPNAMWWAITTLTTVGYGDAIPITAAGKIVAGITMILGLGLFALPVGIVATAFATEIHRRDFVVTWGMLSRVPMFEGFDVETMGEVMGALKSHVVNPDSKLAEPGAPADAMYFIVSGHVEEEHPRRGKRMLKPGELFGEEAVLKGEPHEVTVTAKSRARVLALSAEDFALLARRYPELRERMINVAAKRPGQS